jgi:FMN reductase
LLKVFLDLLPADSLVGKVVVPLMTGGGPHHLLAIDHGLKPAIASLGATLTPTGVYGVTTQFHQGTPNVDLKARVQRAVNEALALAAAHGTKLTLPDPSNQPANRS